MEERKYTAEIADLIRYVRDQPVLGQRIEQLVKLCGKVKLRHDAIAQARGKARKRSERFAPMNEMQQDTELLRQFSLLVRKNCYYATDDDDEELARISSFIMEPLFHIEDEDNGTRIFRIRDMYNICRIIELKESESCSLSNFQQKVGSLGNYVWSTKINKLSRVKEYLYSKADIAERIRKSGWNDTEGFFVFGNGILMDGTFREVDKLGTVRGINSKAFYTPATSKIYIHNQGIFQFGRLIAHENRSSVRLYDYVTGLVEVLGENAAITLSYLLSTLFHDIILRRTRHFPILDLFGERGTGKTTLAISLWPFFLHDVGPPNLGITPVPTINDRASRVVNTLVVLDEYKDDLDIRRIAYLRSLWGDGGQTKKNASTDGMAAQTIATTSVALYRQDGSTQDMAFYTRVIFLAFSKTSFNQAERGNYEGSVALCNLGPTHLTVEVLNHRELPEKNFLEIHVITRRELATKLENETIHDCIFSNWVVPLITFRTLETVIHAPFSYTELPETAFRDIRSQNELAQESSEITDPWNMLQGSQTSGKCIEKAYYRIRYLKFFRPISAEEDTELKETRPILYLNMAAVTPLFNSRNMNATINRSNWSIIMSYLKSHSLYLDSRQDRLIIPQPGGLPDYMIKVISGKQVRKIEVDHPKMLCFDCLQLKDAFGLDLETETVSSSLDLSEDSLSDPTPPDTTPPIQEDLPF